MRTRLRPALLLVVALLGAAAAAHGVHHLLGASCEVRQGAQAHACLVCSALASAHLADSGVALTPPHQVRVIAPATAARRAPLPVPHLPGPPRAPPAA